MIFRCSKSALLKHNPPSPSAEPGVTPGPGHKFLTPKALHPKSESPTSVSPHPVGSWPRSLEQGPAFECRPQHLPEPCTHSKPKTCLFVCLFFYRRRLSPGSHSRKTRGPADRRSRGSQRPAEREAAWDHSARWHRPSARPAPGTTISYSTKLTVKHSFLFYSLHPVTNII